VCFYLVPPALRRCALVPVLVLVLGIPGCVEWELWDTSPRPLSEVPPESAASGHEVEAFGEGLSANPSSAEPLPDEEEEPEDFCSFVPDFHIGFCCAAHDDLYEVGGGERERLLADLRLRDCIVEAGRPIIGWLYFVGVRLFGWIYFNWFPEESEPPPELESLPAELAGS